MLETWNWLTSLDADFAFLLALPFVVALAGLARHVFEATNKPRDDQ